MQEGIKIKEDDSVRGRLQDGGGLQVGVNSELINGCSAEKKMLNIVTTISETLSLPDRSMSILDNGTSSFSVVGM